MNKPSRIAAAAVTALSLTWAPVARAGDGHKVPDLRRGAKVIQRAGAKAMLVPLTIHLARAHETPIQSLHRIRVSVERANRALAPHGIRVVIDRVLLMPRGRHGEITSRRDQRRLAAYAPVDGTVHVFLVDRLELGSRLQRDRSIRGMHWRYRGLNRRMKGREYIVVNIDAPTTTLVHEIGHIFGLGHDRGHHNLMCSCRRGHQEFTRRQGLTMRRGLLAYFRESLAIGIR